MLVLQKYLNFFNKSNLYIFMFLIGVFTKMTICCVLMFGLTHFFADLTKWSCGMKKLTCKSRVKYKNLHMQKFNPVIFRQYFVHFVAKNKWLSSYFFPMWIIGLQACSHGKSIINNPLFLIFLAMITISATYSWVGFSLLCYFILLVWF